MTEYTRIVYELGGDKHTCWAKAETVTLSAKDGIAFEDLGTGRVKTLNAKVPMAVTNDVDLPPHLDDAEVLEGDV